MDQLTSGRFRSSLGAIDEQWWQGGVIYQVYPRSFQDSNDDGIGDLSGIVQRIPYIADLGVDAIWISPFFESPMKDFGYDVSDYKAVAPEFGTLEELDTLLETAHGYGLKVIIDLVISHTSDKHAWFVESRSSRDNAKADWYVWADPRPDGTPPNNWLSVFGGSAWQWDGGRRQYYLHNFLESQPDLNFHNESVRKELLDLAEFWLERGVDGFRLDTVNFYYCDKELRSNPALDSESIRDTIAPRVNPYNFQNHIFDKNRPENIGFLEDLRNRMDNYSGRFAVGEVGDAQKGLEIVGQYTQGESRLHSCYAFDLLSGDSITADGVSKILGRFERLSSDGWASWACSNHDVTRHRSRWNLDNDGLKCVATMLMCLRGSICVYQGEELGLSEARIGWEDMRDPYGKEFWPEFRGRDGCRTPMVWNSDQRNGGFSDAKPWLPVEAEHLAMAVSEQTRESGSILEHYGDAIRLRSLLPALRLGRITNIGSECDMLYFQRTHEGSQLYCAFNLCGSQRKIALPQGDWEIKFRTGLLDEPGSRVVSLDKWGHFVAERAG